MFQNWLLSLCAGMSLPLLRATHCMLSTYILRYATALVREPTKAPISSKCASPMYRRTMGEIHLANVWMCGTGMSDLAYHVAPDTHMA